MTLPPLPERETLRLHQANERTVLAWIRTALAMMGFGFVVARFGLFLRELSVAHAASSPPHGASWSLWVGLALALLGAATALVSVLRFRETTAAIERHEVGRPGGERWIYVIGALVVVAGLSIAVLLASTGGTG